jgi:L-2-hydroxyglutarate oxidase
MTDVFDVAIVGGGIVGLATAEALLDRRVGSLVVREAEPRLAAHQTGNNSGVVHTGLYYRPGSLKARLCVEGREQLLRFCQEHGVASERCGKVVVATRDSELPALAELERRGRANGLAGVRRLDPDGLRALEPHASGIAALHVPESGIADFTGVAAALAGEVTEGGGEIRTGARLLAGVSNGGEQLVAQTTTGDIRCRLLVSCAGLQADRVARLCGDEPGLRIVPFRGEYYELREERRHLVRNLVYPVPDPRFPFLGVHFTRRVDGSVEAGPNAVLALQREGYSRRDASLRDLADLISYRGFWRLARTYWRTGVEEIARSLSREGFARALRRLVPEVEADDLRPAAAGVRAQAVSPDGKLLDDFRIVTGRRTVHVLNAPSPAATASLAIGRYIAERVASRLS